MGHDEILVYCLKGNNNGFVISQNLAQSHKGRKVNLLTLKDIFLAPWRLCAKI